MGLCITYSHMTETIGGATPQVAEPTVVTPATTPVVEASSLKQDNNFDSRIQGAKSITELRSIKKEMAAQPAKVAEVTPAAVVETPAEPAVTETVGEATPAEPETPAAGEAGAEPEAVAKDDGGDGPITPLTGKRAHMRFAEDDQVGRLAASFMLRNRDMPMEEAVAKARSQLGLKTDGSTEPAKSDLPETVEAVDTAIEKLEAERSKALIELRFEDVAASDNSLRRLDRQRLKLEKDGERQQTEQAQAYDRAFAASDARAVELYEFASQPDSAGSKRMLEIDADYKARNSPIYNDPNKPLIIADMVASELRIAPRRKGAPPAPAKAAVPATPAPKKQVLPGGASQTIPVNANQKPADVAKVEGIKTIADLQRIKKEMGYKLNYSA